MLVAKFVIRAQKMQTIKNRIEENAIFKPDTGCWIWQGKIKGTKPIIKVAGKYTNVIKLVLDLYRGIKVETTRDVKQTCKDPMCIRPEHLICGKKPSQV